MRPIRVVRRAMARASRMMILCLLWLVLLTLSPALAQTYELDWWTVDGGGATFSTGGAFELGGTIAQPDAGVMWGGLYALAGGFWASTSPLTVSLEHGTVWAGSDWTTVNLTGYFVEAPVVVAGPATSLGWQPGVVRIRNVTSTSFQIKLQEWDYLDGVHCAERMPWIAVHPATWDLGGGKKLSAGRFVTNKTNVYSPKWVAFPEAFSGTPVVLTQVQTLNGSDAVTDRICGVYLGGMHFSMQEQESKSDGHCNETVGYVAVSEGATSLFGEPCDVKRTGAVVTHNPYTLTGSQGLCSVRVREEQSKDAETLHWAGEKVGFISLAGQPPLVADVQTCNGKDPCELRCTLLTAAPTPGSVLSADDQWQAVHEGGLGRVLDVEPWDGAGPYALLVRAEREGGAKLHAVPIVVGDTVAEALPLERACEPGETLTLSAPVSIADRSGVLLFSHWEVDGAALPAGQAMVQVEMAGDREAIAVYVRLP